MIKRQVEFLSDISFDEVRVSALAKGACVAARRNLGAIRHSPVPPTDPFAPLACSCQLDPPAPDSNTAPRGLRSTRTRAAPLRHPTPTDHQSRYSLTRVYRGSPGYIFLYLLRFFRVCQGPELHLQSNSLAVCSRDAPSPLRRVAPTLSLGLAPSPILSVSRNSTTGHVYSWAIGPQPATLPQRGTPLASPAVLGPTALEPPRSAAPPGATTPIAGRPPYSPGAVRLQERCLAAPRLGATTLGLSGPFRHFRSRGGTRPGSPAAQLRLPSRRVGSQPQPATPPQRGDSSGVPCCPRADRPRAASVLSPARGHDLDRGPAPVFSWGRPPPGALPRCTPTGRNHSRALGPLPALPQQRGGDRPGSPAAPLRLPSRRVGSGPDARPRPRPRAQASSSRAHQRANFAPRHSPGSSRGPTLARPLPPAQPLRSDLDRPGEGALSDVFSPAPPEREIQACAISGSLATPQRGRNCSCCILPAPGGLPRKLIP
ncbi:hypothetical protein NDU88_006694 [Pleurodeles waltl]|uniref:Basic proline-rich protein-like n=1 Tax=Pleurodeles waltl TaxID=8319 RepID=A0AAV7QIF0_PLEWA|nr:hypothetical protein NDU88_006694 [Pleurodeles waltl]